MHSFSEIWRNGVSTSWASCVILHSFCNQGRWAAAAPDFSIKSRKRACSIFAVEAYLLLGRSSSKIFCRKNEGEFLPLFVPFSYVYQSFSYSRAFVWPFMNTLLGMPIQVSFRSIMLSIWIGEQIKLDGAHF